jgi:hypothetical protein
MDEDVIGAVYAFVERAYVRLQAADMLTQCLTEGKLAPLQNMVETLVVAGPEELESLREILEEVFSRKNQLKNDQHQVFSKLEKELLEYGFRLGGIHSPLSLIRLTPAACLALLRSQKVMSENDQLACVQHLDDALDLLKALSRSMKLLEEVEFYIQDWLWVLIYQSTRLDWEQKSQPSRSRQRPH